MCDKNKTILEVLSGRGEVKRYDFTQINKTKKGFCYEVGIDGTISHYEVFRLKINNRFGCESYPTSKGFGIWAWTYTWLGEATQKLHSL